MAGRSTSVRAWWGLSGLVVGYVLIQVVAGATESPLTPLFPSGVRPATWTTTGARWIGLSRLGPAALTGVSLVLMAGLVGAFLVVVVEAWRGRLGLAVVIGAVAMCLVASVAGPLLLSQDVYSYAAYGRMYALHHANPYLQTPASFPSDPFTPVVSTEWLHTRSVYGPIFTLASAGVSRAWPGSPGATIVAFKVLAGVAVGLAALLAAIAARARWPEKAPLAAAAVGLNPALVVQTVGGAHNDAWVAGFLAAALAMAVRPWGRRRRKGRAADAEPPSLPAPSSAAALATTALITLAALVKVVAGLPLLIWWWYLVRGSPSRRRVVVAAGHVGLAAALGAAATSPLFAGWRTVTAVADLASRQGWASGARLVARGAQALGRSVAGDGGATALSAAVYAVFLAAIIPLLWVLLREGSTLHTAPAERLGDGFGISLLLFALAAPYLLPWYVAWFVPFLPFMADDLLVWIGLAAGAVLAMTGIPAEPAPDPSLWRAMVVGVHYGAAVVMLGLFLLAGIRIARPQRAGVGDGLDRARLAPTAVSPPSPR